MGSNGAREKALQLLREVPRLSHGNLRGLPKVAGVQNVTRAKRRGRGQNGGDYGWGTSARAKQYFGPLGYESGSTPIQRKTSFERSYNYALRTTRQFPPVTLGQLQLTIDLGRIDTSKPVDMAALCASKAMFVEPEKNQFGFNLTHDVGLDTFSAKVNLEVQWASEQAIMAVERAGGRIITGYFDLHSVIALRNPLKFFERGAPIPRRLAPPQDLMEYYSNPVNRGYLACPKAVAEERLKLAQKYGYDLPDEEEEESFMLERKDVRQIFYGLQPGWIVSLADKEIFKPKDPELSQMYQGELS